MRKRILIILNILVLIPLMSVSQEIRIPQLEFGVRYLYEYHNDSLSEIMSVTFLSPETISFSYTYSNNSTDTQINLQGNATLRKGDAELDEDEDGLMYLVDLFEYQKECYLAIRIDAETHSKMRVVTGDCHSNKMTNSVACLSLVH